jgi:hypothetical protein
MVGRLMNTSTALFALPRKLEPDLVRVRAYWEGLKRGEADMPFWDDLNLSTLPDLSGRLMLIEVFDKPARFRLGMLGDELKKQDGGDAVGRFLDEIDAHSPLHYLSSQSSAAVESRAATYYRHGPSKRSGPRTADGYARLLLPMWGDGRIGMLLGAVAWK